MNDNDKIQPDIEQQASAYENATRRRRPLWMKLMKWLGITLLSIVILVIIAFCVLLFYLTPERLTPIFNRYTSEYLNADVNAGRVELTFWSTFPRLNVQVDDLHLVSRSLHTLSAEERKALPADADSLLNLECFSGGIDIMRLVRGDISLYDVELTNPSVNLFVYNDSITNFDIIPPSEPSEEETPMPEISVNRFALIGSMPVRYRSPADSIDFCVTLSRTELSGTNAPTYKIAIGGSTAKHIAATPLPELPFSVDGNVIFDLHNPDHIGLEGFTLSLMGVEAMFDARIDMSSDLTLDEFGLTLPKIELGALMTYIPDSYLGPLAMLDTDLRLSLGLRLLRPFAPAQSTVPQIELTALASASRLRYERLNLNRFDLDVKVVADGSDLDRSTIEINTLRATGQAVDLSIKGTVANPLSDPLINGSFDGSIAFSRLPDRLLKRLPFTIGGTLHGQADIRVRMSQLTPKKFHRTRIDGSLALTDFNLAMTDGSMDAYIGDARFKLGSSSRIQVGDRLVDSLLTASLTIDTAMLSIPGLHLAGRELALNVGSRNVATSSDTSQINPIGGSMSAGLLTLSADSAATRLRLRDAKVRGALRRYNNNARAPQLDLSVEARRISYRDADMRASLTKGKSSMSLHPRSRRANSPRMQATIDSLAAFYPDLSTDSLTVLARRSMPRRNKAASDSDGRENIDFGIDNSLAAWLRTWQLSGDFSAERGKLYTPYYPVRNTLSDIDMSFSTDSMVIRHTRLHSGKSDFVVDGAVRNISRALTSKRMRTPIEIEFDVRSDTIDVNDITAAMLRGAAYGNRIDPADLDAMASDDDDLDFEELPPDDGETAPLIIPSNVKASLRMSSNRVLYGDIWLHDFRGAVNVYDGAISLEGLHALTDLGAVDLTALYSAPTVNDLSFAAGMFLSKLNLRKFLSLMPQIDSIMPMLKEVDGIVDARIALSTELDSLMDLRLNTLDMALRLSGDSLVLLDSETFRTVAKWLLFKNKERNMIDHMDVEMTVHDGWIDLYPVVFDMDRYRLGVVGNNDMDFNLDYHVAVLKSPIPFKFGINITGTPEKMKIRLGKARLNEKTVAGSHQIADSLRVNLISEMRKTFSRGVRTAGSRGLRVQQQMPARQPSAATLPDDPDDKINAADSVMFIREGLIEAPEGFVMPEEQADSVPQDKKKQKKK